MVPNIYRKGQNPGPPFKNGADLFFQGLTQGELEDFAMVLQFPQIGLEETKGVGGMDPFGVDGSQDYLRHCIISGVKIGGSKQTQGTGSPLVVGLQDQPFYLLPGISPGTSQVTVRGVGKDDGSTPLGPKFFHVFRRIVDIYVGSHGALIFHKAKVPVGNIVPIEPFHRLGNGSSVKIL
jgi:hypothetical protein